ncbi:unnamed protein product [Heterobilharzia americana]|nr:unnamed protein product [Heterobilharzia americana]
MTRAPILDFLLLWFVSRTSIMPNQLSYLAVVQNSSVYFWFVHHDQKLPLDNSLANNNTSDSKVSDSPVLTYKLQSTSTFPLHSICWDPKSCKLAAIDKFGSNVCFRRLSVGENSECETNTSNTLSFSLQSQDSVATCIAFPQRSGKYLAVGVNTGSVNLYNCHKQISFRCQLRCDSIPCGNSYSREIQPTCMSWALNDRIVASGYSNGSVILFLSASSTATGECENFTLPFPSNSGCSDSSIPACSTLKTSTLDSTLLFCAYADGSIILWNIEWPVNGDACQRILNHWDPKVLALTNPLNLISCEHHVDLALSSPSDGLLFSVGAPDLHLRMWNLSTSYSGPMKTLSPTDEQHGYLSVDVASNTSTLATGLVNGEVWLYDTRDLRSPTRCIYTGSNVPVYSVLFSLTFQSGDKVKFDSSKSHYSTSLHEGNSTTKLTDDKTSVCSAFAADNPLNSTRQPFSELTNQATDQPQRRKWASLLREFPMPELSLSSDPSVSESMRDQGSEKLSFTDTKKEAIYFKSEFCTDDSLNGTASSNKFLPIELLNHNNDGTTTKETPHISLNITTELLDQYFSARLGSVMSEINWLHNQLLFRYTKLEGKLDQISEQFHTAVLQMKRETDLLRYALNKRLPF